MKGTSSHPIEWAQDTVTHWAEFTCRRGHVHCANDHQGGRCRRHGEPHQPDPVKRAKMRAARKAKRKNRRRSKGR